MSIKPTCYICARPIEVGDDIVGGSHLPDSGVAHAGCRAHMPLLAVPRDPNPTPGTCPTQGHTYDARGWCLACPHVRQIDEEPVEEPTEFVTKDSGRRRHFDTGSRRDARAGKGRYDLLPIEGIRRLAQLFERGAEKYEDRNWEKGQPLSVYADSMLRHAFQAAAGVEDEDHAASAAWNALALITTQERIRAGLLPAELDDLPCQVAAA